MNEANATPPKDTPKGKEGILSKESYDWWVKKMEGKTIPFRWRRCLENEKAHQEGLSKKSGAE